jgi:hypothetical protein
LPVAGDFDGDGDIDLLYVNYLPENPNDLFHGSALPLRLMRNGSSHSNTLTVVMRRSDKKNIAGTAVVLYRGGRGYWKMVSGGGGRIQTGPFITFSLGNSASADSMSISWPDGVKQKIVGPLYPGKLELEVDLTAPKLEFVTWPGDKVEGGMLLATRVPLNGILQVTDNSQISRLQVIVRTPLTGREDTLRLTDKISNGKAAFSFAGPMPGDSLFYYSVAIDIYNNKSRLPAAQNEYYRLRAEPGVLKGDVDGDLQVNTFDVIRLLALIKNNQSLPSQTELKAGDLNLDGKLDIFDVISLLALIKQVNPGTNVQASFD